MSDRWLACVRIGFALLTLGAIVYQALNLIEAGVFNPTRFFLFFTILSNLTAAAAFLEGGRRQLVGAPPVPDLWRGFAVVVMTVTFIVFAVLLSDLQEELQTNVVWVDTVLHRLMPVAVMADWLIEPPHGPLTFRRVLVPWLAPPLVWTTFTLIRGAIDGWYPYPFLDPADGGYGSVALYAVAILALLLAVIWLVATVAQHSERGAGSLDPATLEAMTIQRMDNVLIVVDDLKAAIGFFADLGLELEGETTVEGQAVDRLVGLDGVRSDIATMRTPDGHGRVELDKFLAPKAVRTEPEDPPLNTRGMRRIMFAVDDIAKVLARLQAHGAELVGEVVQYEDQYRLCYVRGPEGIVVGLAEELS